MIVAVLLHGESWNIAGAFLKLASTERCQGRLKLQDAGLQPEQDAVEDMRKGDR